MRDEEKIMRVNTLRAFGRELGRSGEETLEVPGVIVEEYGVFLKDTAGFADPGRKLDRVKRSIRCGEGRRTRVCIATSQDHVQIFRGTPVLR